MVTSVNSLKLKGAKREIKAKGLADHHAYTILTTLTVTDENEEVV